MMNQEQLITHTRNFLTKLELGTAEAKDAMPLCASLAKEFNPAPFVRVMDQQELIKTKTKLRQMFKLDVQVEHFLENYVDDDGNHRNSLLKSEITSTVIEAKITIYNGDEDQACEEFDFDCPGSKRPFEAFGLEPCDKTVRSLYIALDALHDLSPNDLIINITNQE